MSDHFYTLNALLMEPGNWNYSSNFSWLNLVSQKIFHHEKLWTMDLKHIIFKILQFKLTAAEKNPKPLLNMLVMILLLCIVSVQNNLYSASICLSLSYHQLLWIWSWKTSFTLKILYCFFHKSKLYLLSISSLYIHKTVIICMDRENKTKQRYHKFT